MAQGWVKWLLAGKQLRGQWGRWLNGIKRKSREKS